MMILLIDCDGTKLGQMSIEQARKIAIDRGLELVKVGKDVFKVADLGKLKYEKKLKDRSQRIANRSHKLKEMQLRPVTDDGDLGVKARKVREFVLKGMKTKIVMKFKGREVAFRESGMKKMLDFIALVMVDGGVVVDKPPVFEGRVIIAYLIPAKS